MKKVIIAVFYTWISSLAFGQTTFSISFDRTIDTVEVQADWAYFNAIITNPSTIDSVNIKITIINKNILFGWSIYLCPSSTCLLAVDTTATVILDTLQTETFQVQLDTDVMEIGNGNFTIRFENVANSTDYIDTMLYIRYVPETTNGIEENRIESNYLFQNYPNPFSNLTTIQYHLNTPGATIIITDVTGRQIIAYSLNGKEGSFLVNENLNIGTYFYSLHQNGKLLETKKFIVQSNVHKP